MRSVIITLVLLFLAFAHPCAQQHSSVPMVAVSGDALVIASPGADELTLVHLFAFSDGERSSWNAGSRSTPIVLHGYQELPLSTFGRTEKLFTDVTPVRTLSLIFRDRAGKRVAWFFTSDTDGKYVYEAGTSENLTEMIAAIP
jgi:hypothetical protein